MSTSIFENVAAKNCSHLTGVRPKREISGSDKPKNHTTAGRERKYRGNKEKDRRRRKKSNGHTLSFYKGYFEKVLSDNIWFNSKKYVAQYFLC